MRDEMKRTMFELFGVGSEDDKVLAAGGKKPAVKPEPVKTAPVQAPVQPVVKAKAPAIWLRVLHWRAHCALTAMWRSPEHSRARSLPPAR